jgi:DNA-binding transcriptional regulator LsrR (DeoR family)
MRPTAVPHGPAATLALDHRPGRVDQPVELGGVGNMCAQFFDADGVPLDADLNRRAISIGLDGLKGIGLVVAAASGRQKAPAILGALRGGYVDVLVSDDDAIELVLDMHERGRDGTP